jgi:hypothetical protein
LQELSIEHVVSGGPHANTSKAPLFQGAASYILLADGCYRSIIDRAPEAIAQPLPIEGCNALYSCFEYSHFTRASAYVKAHQLCSHQSLVPGLTRFIALGEPTVEISHFLYTALQPPKVLPAHHVTLEHLQVKVNTFVIKYVL